MADGYARSYQELVDTTEWDKYGRGKDDRCENCMAHCGYEPTAVNATMASPKQSVRATADVLKGSLATIWSRGPSVRVETRAVSDDHRATSPTSGV